MDPVENIGPFLRDNWLSNTLVKSCDGILDHCCRALNNLIKQPQRITSVGLRQSWMGEDQ